MAFDPTTPRSRRALLTAAVAATAATVAQAVVKPLPVAAITDDGAIVHVGDDLLDVTLTTTLQNATNSNAIFELTSTDGTGLKSLSTTAAGVYGSSLMAAGVFGASKFGSGVYATSQQATALHAEGTKAIDVIGKAHFSRSGKATVAAGKKSVTVTVPGGLDGTPLCFANLRTYRAGIGVAAVRPNYPSAGKIRIYLTKTVSGATAVSWLVLD
jgi:hypothetical protein